MSDQPSSEWPPPSIEDLMKRCYVLIDTDTGELAWGDTYWDGWIYSNWLKAQQEIHDTRYKVVRASDLPPESFSRTREALVGISNSLIDEGGDGLDLRKLRSESHWATPQMLDGGEE